MARVSKAFVDALPAEDTIAAMRKFRRCFEPFLAGCGGQCSTRGISTAIFRQGDDAVGKPHRLTRNPPPTRSCAIVGNGGSLLLDTRGGEIDAHEAVVRFNGGVTKGFEQYVGTNTTFRLANTQHMGFHERDEIVLQHITIEVRELSRLTLFASPSVQRFHCGGGGAGAESDGPVDGAESEEPQAEDLRHGRRLPSVRARHHGGGRGVEWLLRPGVCL